MTDTAALPPVGGSDTPSTPMFVRPREGRMFAGVCAGIAERWQLDVTLVRIGAVVLTLLSGVGFAAYVATWLLTPSDDGPAPLHADSPFATSARRRGERLMRRGPVTLLVVVALLIVFGAFQHVWHGIPAGLLAAVALLALVFGTRLGRWAAVAVAAVVALLLATVGLFGDHFGTRTYSVASAEDLHSSYDYGVGAMRLDLTQLGGLTGRHETRVHLGRGNVTITVPRDVAVVVHARAGVGSVTVNGHKVSGFDAEQTLPVGPGAGTSADRLVIDATVGVGSVTVR